MPKLTIVVGEDDKLGVFIKNIEPYESVRILVATALALLDGSAHVTFNEGPPLMEDEEEDIISSLVSGGTSRDN